MVCRNAYCLRFKMGGIWLWSVLRTNGSEQQLYISWCRRSSLVNFPSGIDFSESTFLLGRARRNLCFDVARTAYVYLKYWNTDQLLKTLSKLIPNDNEKYHTQEGAQECLKATIVFNCWSKYWREAVAHEENNHTWTLFMSEWLHVVSRRW